MSRVDARGRFVALPISDRVKANIRFDDGPDFCWTWTGHRDADGYGLLTVGNKGRRATHILLEMDGRPRPDGAHALHSCDNPSCVRPSHLRWGTNQENIDDKVRRGRMRSGDAHPSRIRPEVLARGERVGGARLTEAKVVEILASSETLVVLGDRYGVDMSTISAIKRGRTWRHVPRPEARA